MNLTSLFSTYIPFLVLYLYLFWVVVFKGEGAEKYMDGVVGKGPRRLILVLRLGSFSGVYDSLSCP